MIKKSKFLAALLTLCIMAGLLAACGITSSPSDNSDLQEPENKDSTDYSGLAKVETQFGTLYYPEKWSSNMKTEVKDGKNGSLVIFSTILDDRSYDLFHISIGDENGQYVGQLTGNDDIQRNVFVTMPELENISTMPQETQDLLYAMQEAVNVIIENLN